MKQPETLGELLYWSYANLSMAHAAVVQARPGGDRGGYIIRARLYKGLCTGTMNLGSLIDDEKVKMNFERACCYCGGDGQLSVDHLLPGKRGGPDNADNIVWCCRSCNSSKGARDVLEWLQARGEFPPLMLLRRYLKLAILHCTERGMLGVPLAEAPALELPFSTSSIPVRYPKPAELRLWVEAQGT